MGKSFRESLNEQLRDPGFKKEWEALEPEFQVIRTKAMIAFNSMRAKAAKRGYMSDVEVEAEIAAARRGE